MALPLAPRLREIPSFQLVDGPAQHREATLCLASNELAYTPVPAVRRAIVAASARLNRYPDPGCFALRELLSDGHDVPPENIAVGNGSCDLITALGSTLLDAEAEMVCAWPTFAVYLQMCAAMGARAVTVPVDEAYRHDLPRMLAAITPATRLLVICNPNNPTGTAVPVGQIEALLDQVPRGVCVVLDEAYHEFNTLDGPVRTERLLARHPNLLLLRTFSKAHGLSALRIGYALCGDQELPPALDAVRPPFPCNAIAQAAAAESLSHPRALADRVAKALAQRAAVSQALDELGLRSAVSQANFAWIELDDAAHEDRVMAGLLARGVQVRGGRALGHPGALRATYGTAAENERFLAALAEALGVAA
jgi:histidinol-phosphate aminotransferase